jgi:hypothetical protein
LCIYLVVFDFVDYWMHRGQHRFNWWWSLHSLHHSQRQMTLWSDNRNHLLDDVLRDSLLVLLAQAIGVPPGQFVAVVAFTQLSESLPARQPAPVVRPRGRAAVDQPALSTGCTTAWASGTRRPASQHPGGVQLWRAAALVGHAVSHRQFRAAL